MSVTELILKEKKTLKDELDEQIRGNNTFKIYIDTMVKRYPTEVKWLIIQTEIECNICFAKWVLQRMKHYNLV